MNIIEKQRVLDALNSLEVVDENGGDSAYLIVDSSNENLEKLNVVGVTKETALKYGDEETFCILALAFSEGYADLYDGSKLIAFDRSFEVSIEKDKFITLYKLNGKSYIMLSRDGGEISTVELTNDQLVDIKSVIA